MPAPSGSLHAVVVVEMGGGAAGWCHSCVVVEKPAAAYDPQVKLCTTERQLFRCSAKLTLAWVSPDSLTVKIAGDSVHAPVVAETFGGVRIDYWTAE